MPDRPKSPKQSRDERLAAALRANLRRRKEDQRSRPEPAARSAPEPSPERPKPAGNRD